MSSQAFADAALGTGVNYNNGAAVSAGQTGVPAFIDIENTSTPNTITVTLNTIQHLPSCGGYSVITCTSPDAGVFAVNPPSGTGRVGTACAGTAFTFTPTGDALGTYNVTWAGTITLAAPNVTDDLDSCVIDFTVDVLRAPSVDASGAIPGLQTRPSATTTGTGSNLTEAVGFGTTLVTVNRANPGIATVATAGPLPAGSAISDTATITGGLNPTGTVTFNLYGPNDATCAGPPVFTSSNRPLSGGPPTATSAAFTANLVGTYRWIASYSGDANNNPVAGACNDANEASVIVQDTPSFATVASAATVAGGSLTDTATLSNATNPTGTITFNLYGPNDATCSNAPAFTTSVAVSGNGSYVSAPAFTPTLVGTYRWIASYSGDANNVAVSGACNDPNESTIVNADTPTLSTTASAGGVIGVSVTDTATLANGTNPTGTITFRLYGPSATAVCNAGNLVFTSNPIAVAGNGSYGPSSPLFTPTVAGTYRWIASYSGDANNNAVTGACGDAGETVVITQSTPGLSTTASAGGVIGVSVTDSATLTGGSNPTGTLTFRLYGPSATAVCNASNLVFTSAPIAVSGAGIYGPSGSFTPTAVGTYRWIASYSGDANNAAVTGACGDANETVVITQSTPAISTVASAGGVVGSTSVTDTATLSGGFNPTGSITFRLYGPSATPVCNAGNLVFTSSAVTVSGNGNYTSTPTFAPTTAGTYRWIATYSGDANNAGIAGACGDANETVVITQATPGIVTVASATTTVGNPISDTVTVSGSAGTPTGTVTFSLYGPNDNICSAAAIYTNTVALAAGTANSGSFTPTAPGVYRWVAVYNGNTNYASVSHPCNSPNESTTVDQRTPALATVASAGGPIGTAVTDQATLSGGFNPTGTIVFTLYGPNDATCSNAPVYTSSAIAVSGNGSYTSAPAFTTTAAGVYRWRAVYSGDANNAGVSHPCNAANESVTIGLLTPTIATTASATGPVGTVQLSDIATVTGTGPAPTGSVTFNLYGPNDATCSGAAIYTSTVALTAGSANSGNFSPTAPGVYRWTASYSGDANYSAVSHPCNAPNESTTVTQAAPSIATTASAGGPVGTTSVTDTATLSGGVNPTGSITFRLYGPSATPVCNAGNLVFTSSAVTVSGNGNYTSTPTFAPTTAGTYRWIATYSGDTNNAGAAGACGDANETVVISQATPGIVTVAPATATVGSTISDTATVAGTAGTPTGTVTFSLYGPNDNTCSAAAIYTDTVALVAGVATSGNFTALVPGVYRWVAVYNGDTNYASVSHPCNSPNESTIVNQATPTLVTVASAGGPIGTQVTDQATLSGGFNPTGTITFTLYGPNDATCANAPVFTSSPIAVSGNGSYTSAPPFTTTAAGVYRWRAVYSGDANNAGLSHPCNAANESVNIGLLTPTIATTASAPGVVGTVQLSDIATVTGSGPAPTGSVTFNLYGPNDAACTGAVIYTSTVALAAGTANSGNFTPTAPGVYRWTASYGGDANYGAVSHACNAPNESTTVNQAAPSIVTTASAGGPLGATQLSDTATVSGGLNPTGTVTFNLYGPNDATCSGAVIFTATVALAGGTANSGGFTPTQVGVYRWTATYNGDANNAAASHPCNAPNESATITPGTLTLVTQTTPSVALGTPITDTATLSGGANPTGSITFRLYGPNDTSCANAPVFTSNAVTVNGNGSYVSAPAYTPTAPGTYRWIASYSGDANNSAVSGACNDANETVTVGAPPPSVPIPTLSQWALLLASLMLAGSAFAVLRRQRRR